MSIFVKWSAEWMPFVPTDCFLRSFSKAKKVAQQRTARTSHVVAKEGHKLFSVRQSNFCREKGAFPLEQILDYKSWRLFDLFGNRRASWHTDSAEHLDFFFLYIFFSCFLNFITKKRCVVGVRGKLVGQRRSQRQQRRTEPEFRMTGSKCTALERGSALDMRGHIQPSHCGQDYFSFQSWKHVHVHVECICIYISIKTRWPVWMSNSALSGHFCQTESLSLTSWLWLLPTLKKKTGDSSSSFWLLAAIWYAANTELRHFCQTVNIQYIFMVPYSIYVYTHKIGFTYCQCKSTPPDS